MDFGENFRKIRHEVGFTQKEVAFKLGIYQSNVSDWENDVSRPDYEKLIQLSKLYNVSINELLGVDDNF